MSSRSLKIKKVEVYGVIPSLAFQRAKQCALALHRSVPQRFPQPDIHGMLELDWNEKLVEWRRTRGREFWCLRRPVAVFFDDELIGSDVDLIRKTSFGNHLCSNMARKNMQLVSSNTKEEYLAYLKKSKRIFCFLDICVDSIYVGTLTFELYSDILPRTCENFTALCEGTRGETSYRGSKIHRIVKKGWIQGGDIDLNKKRGSDSCYCSDPSDEGYAISHDRSGVLSMANNGKHNNGSQFFVTLQPSQWMDRYYVAFGQLIEGVQVLRCLENLETYYECPLQKVEIKNCGKMDLAYTENVDSAPEIEQSRSTEGFETIAKQVMRLVLEALTEALAIREHVEDVLDERDVPSRLDLQMYFQGLYSTSEHILHDSAEYLRGLRREFFRYLKPSATEIVEDLIADFLLAFVSERANLDDLRETVTHPVYKDLIESINMEVIAAEKQYVQKFIDQLAATAENILYAVSERIQKMKGRPTDFENQMQTWVTNFILQKYEINLEGMPPCIPTEPEPETKLVVSDYFNVCKSGSSEDSACEPHKDQKQKSQGELDDAPSFLELLYSCREKLNSLREPEKRKKQDKQLEKHIRDWLKDVVYVPETEWIREAVFDSEKIFDHTAEMLYGAMTVGLLEMYFQAEQKDNSLRWMWSYVSEKGNETMSNFAKQVHRWLEGEEFCYGGLLSKHSIASKASLLSLSLSLASLIADNNSLKREVKIFVHDLWRLFFCEMCSEIDLENILKVPQVQEAEDIEQEHSSHRGEDEMLEENIPEPDVIDYGEPIQEQYVAIYENLQEEEEQVVPEQEEERSYLPLQEQGDLYFQEHPGEELYFPGESLEDKLQSSVEEERRAPYALPSWVMKLTEITKRALWKMSELSRLPKRLELTKDSKTEFDEKMKDWLGYDPLDAPTVTRPQLIDFIQQHHVSLHDLHTTARSFLRKRAFPKLVAFDTRKTSAQTLAGDLVVEVVEQVMGHVPPLSKAEKELITDLLASVVEYSSRSMQLDTEEWDGE